MKRGNTVVKNYRGANHKNRAESEVTHNGAPFGSGNATTSSSGEVTFIARNAANGTYVTTVTGISKSGLGFEGSTPANSFIKGTTAVPASFCRDAASLVVAAGNARVERARNIKARHSDALFNLEDVAGHGLSIENGRPVIEVYLEQENAASRARIPAHLENVPIRIIVTGPFTGY